MYCNKCGQEVDSKTVMCGKCGSTVHNKQEKKPYVPPVIKKIEKIKTHPDS